MAPAVSLRRACAAEFVGTLVFQLLGGSASYAPFNGAILSIVVYMTASVSGGVVNPAVALALATARELPWRRCLAYVAAEMLGAIFGALLSAFADPTAPSLWLWSFDGLGPGCVPQLLMPEVFMPIFVWEAAGTFVLCSTVFATAVAQPGAGSVAPLAIGLSVAVNVGTSGAITGGCYNPARFLGPALVYGCRLHLIWLYLAAEAFGALAAALWHLHVSAPVLPAEQVALRGREAPSSSCCESSGAEMMSTAPL